MDLIFNYMQTVMKKKNNKMQITAPSVTLEHGFDFIFEGFHRQGHIDALWHTRGTPGNIVLICLNSH